MIYLDHAAATPVSKKAYEAMKPYFAEEFFNPSAPYLSAKHVRTAYEKAKDEIAHTIGAKGADLIITAGATESINLAFTALSFDGWSSGNSASRALVLATEHPAVLAQGGQTIAVDKTGMILLDDLKAKITDETELISVSLANNELGTIQPLAEIAEIVRGVRAERLRRGVARPLYLHSDASQAMNLIDISVARLGVDLLTLNAAKVGGPKGVGALYVAHGAKLKPLVLGGGQEMGLRSGTENVPGVIGFAAATKEAREHTNGNRKKYEKMVAAFRAELEECAVQPLFLGNKKHKLANFCTLSFPGLDAERLIYKLEEAEVYVSTGAACAASKGEKSHVLSAIGLSDEEINGSLRISFGMLNDEEQAVRAAQLIKQAVLEEAERMGL